ncbi:MAG: hypothetical protein U5L03_15880 [Burkholderiaceae bacterium]|nr:hypothetical protein [Burkholderiaceae bacterium]
MTPKAEPTSRGITFFDRQTPVTAGMIAVLALGFTALGLWTELQVGALPGASTGPDRLFDFWGVAFFSVIGLAAAERAAGTPRRVFRSRWALVVYWLLIVAALVKFMARWAAMP